VGAFAAGTVPYYSGRPAIDFLGKSDPRIARLAPDLSDYWSPGVVLQPSRTTPKIVRPGHNKYDLEYSIKELKPTHAGGFTWHNQSVLDWAKNEYVRVNYKGVHLNLLRPRRRCAGTRWARPSKRAKPPRNPPSSGPAATSLISGARAAAAR
jgi:hypothetical protein